MEVALAGAGLLYTGRLAFSYRRVKSASFDGGASAPPFFFFFFFFSRGCTCGTIPVPCGCVRLGAVQRVVNIPGLGTVSRRPRGLSAT